MKTIQRRADGLPVCSICAHDDYVSIRAGLDAGVRVAELAERHGVTVASIYRHRRSGHDAVQFLPLEDADGLSLADHLHAMLERATAASSALYEKGDLRGGALVGDHALRAAGAMASLGIDGDEIRAQIERAMEARRRAYGLARSVEMVLQGHPEYEETFALAAEAVGAHDLAADFRADPATPRPDPLPQIRHRPEEN